MKLVIIEGIGKQETVEKYLGKGFKVFATRGHMRDLPPKTLAVNVKDNFSPRYEIIDSQKERVQQLRAVAAQADEILLATDPDREGEAISWHVAQILGIPEDQKARIEFNEISKKAIQDSFDKKRAINKDLVDAQQARRVLDRLVGYKISPVICKKIQRNLSAGRVQSVTLRLIVEREREIRNFKPEEYWTFFSILAKNSKKIKATLNKYNGKTIKLKNADEVNKVVSDLDGKDYIVKKVKRSVTKVHAPAPFITSSMQQDAMNKLGMSLKQTTSVAQTLYEGVNIPGEGKIALVTYIRTDSTRVSSDAIAQAREFVETKYGKEYVPAKPNYYASKKSAQDAHEAIRPITLSRTPESLKEILPKAQYSLYKLIYERFLASQMSEAQYDSLAVEISAGNYEFKVNGKTLKFPGFTVVYNAYAEKDDEEESIKIPDMVEGETLKFIEHKYEQKFTKPPARYSEASIVKTMEEKGIGRPATYSPTVNLLFTREYVKKEGKMIVPTELGEKVTDMMIHYFPEIMDVTFTAHMENELDEIEDGDISWQKVVGKFYEGFEEKIAYAMGDSFSLKAPDIKSDVVCDKCGSQMVIKTGKFGKFLACPNYPKCKNTKPLEEESQKKQGDNEEQIICELCGRTMVLKQGKYGPFWACPGYPDCKNIKNVQGNIDYGKCPECGKPLRLMHGKSTFYGCSGYPDCKFTSSSKVLEQKCPTCGAYMIERRFGKTIMHACSQKDCGYKIKVEENASGVAEGGDGKN